MRLYDDLHHGKRLRPSKYAHELRVSVRTIQRDLTVLADILGDAMVRDVDADEVVYTLARERRTPQATAEQVLAITLGSEVARFLPAYAAAFSAGPIIDALSAGLSPGDRHRLRTWDRRVAVIAPARKDYRGRPDVAERLRTVLDAMRRQVRVEVAYLSPRRARSAEGERRMVVEPLGLVLYRDGLYLIVDVKGGEWPASRDARTLLALDRVRHVEPLRPRAHFVMPRDFNAREFFGEAWGIWREPPAVDVTFLVDADYAPYVEERSLAGLQRIEQQTDGGLLVHLRVEGLRELTDWLLSLGEHVEVVEPLGLRDRVRERLTATLARYPAREAT